MIDRRPVSIATVLASGVPLHPHEAVAVVLELCAHLSCQRPSPGVRPALSVSTVTIDDSGVVAVAGGSPGEDDQTVLLAGRLLAEMLDSSKLAATAVVPPRLAATAELAATAGRRSFSSAAQFVAALRRYRPEYGEQAAIRGLFLRWEARVKGLVRVQQPVAQAPPLPEVDEQSRVARALLVSAVLLALAGAGAAYFARSSPGSLPSIVPVLKPAPAAPRPQPARELLRGPQRVSAVTPPPKVAARKAPEKQLTRELATLPPEQGAPPTR